MKNVYLWIADNRVIHHTDLDAAAQLDGLTREPDKTVAAAEYEAAECMARVIGGKIVVGKTQAEIAEQEEQAQISAYKAELAIIDGDAATGRASRDLLLEIAERLGIESAAVEILRGFEAKADPIRKALTPLLVNREAE